MQAPASTTAWALHDLGLATSLGGVVFGRVALHPAIREVSDARERGNVVRKAWKRFSPVQLLSHLAFAASWLVGRKMYSGREIDPATRGLVIAKDVLIATAVTSGVAANVAGYFGMREQSSDQAPPLDAEGEARTADRRVKVAEKVTSISGIVNLISLAGVVGLTAVLAMKASQSGKWSVASRLAP